jgi:hypothetical protein
VAEALRFNERALQLRGELSEEIPEGLRRFLRETGPVFRNEVPGAGVW